MLQTIKVVFTNTKLKDYGKRKTYCFNVDFSVKEGDLLSSPSYDSKLQVVEILPNYYKYFFPKDGSLTNRMEYNTSDIKVLELSNNVIDLKKPMLL